MKRIAFGLLIVLAGCQVKTTESPIAPTVAIPKPAVSAAVGPAPAPSDDPVAAATPAPATGSMGATPSAGDVDDVMEAVFRHMFGSNASGQGSKAGVYCIEVSGGDPDAAFVARFKSVSPTVRKASECSVSTKGQGVFDKRTGRRGLVFRVDSVKLDAADRATVGGGYYEAGLSASGNTYSLEKKAGSWSVVKDVMNWIS